MWKTASFPPLCSSPRPSRHLSHAPQLSPQLPGSSQILPRYSLVCERVCTLTLARVKCVREYLTLRSVLSVSLSASLSVSLQLRWACGASDPLSPTLFLCLSLFAAASGGYGWTALTSTHRGGFGLYRSVQLFSSLCVFLICLSVPLDAAWLFLAPRRLSDGISRKR